MRFAIEITGDKIDIIIGSQKTEREKGKSLTYIPDNYAIIDLETTGLDPAYDEIIEVGALKIKNKEIIDKFESLVKPNGYYIYDDEGNKIFTYVDEFITELTGITNEMLKNAPTIEQVLPEFLNFIQDDIVIGHNINFDVNFLYDYSLNILNHKFQNDYVDLMRLTRKVYPNFENHKLRTISANLEVDTNDKHRALEDCYIVYNCLLKLIEYISTNNIDLPSLFSKKRYALDLRTIKAKTTDFNEDHPFFNKNITFTGKLEKMDRKTAAQLVANLGGHCLNNVTKLTNFLVLGSFDYCTTIKGNKSNKLKKAEKLILEGHDLQILSEEVFYDLILEEMKNA